MNQYLEQLIMIAEASGLPELLNAALSTEARVSADRPMSFVFISDSIYSRKAMLALADALCGEASYDASLPEADKPFCLKIGGESIQTVSRCLTRERNAEDDAAVNEYEYTETTLGAEKSVPYSVTFYCGIPFSFLRDNVCDEADRIILLTNATMALNFNEKEWLTSTAAKYFDRKRTGIYVYNINLLNSADERETLLTFVNSYACKETEPLKVFSDQETLCADLIASDAASLAADRKKASLRNGNAYICETLERYLKDSEISSEQLAAHLNELQRELNTLRETAKIRTTNTIDNYYDQLKFELINAADSYSDKACASICSQLDNSTHFDEEFKQVTPYLRSVWRLFDDRMEEYVGKRNDAIAEELETRIRFDCERIAKLMPISGISDVVSDAAASALQIRIGDAKVENVTAAQKRKRSKALLVVSIGLALAGHPIVGVATLVASRFYEAIDSKTAEGKTLNEMLSSVRSTCEEIKKNVISEITRTCSENCYDAKSKITEIYSGILTEVARTLENRAHELERLNERRQAVQALLDEAAAIRDAL